VGLVGRRPPGAGDLKALFLINARSGARKRYDLEALIRDTCSWTGYQLSLCERKEDLDELIDAAERDGHEVIYAVGGDGTVHEIAKRLAGRALALGILPTGSGNGLARHIGVPVDPRRALAACAAGRVMQVDMGEVNGTKFAGVMGIGLDAEVAHRFHTSAVRGMKTYLREGFRAYRQHRADELTITIDGETIRRPAFVLAIANSAQYGNGAVIAPGASMTDGLLDVILIEPVSLPRAAILLTRLFAGTLPRSGAVIHRQGREITIVRREAGPAHLDGEPVTLAQELRIRVHPGALRLLVPDAGGRL
jgi:diacylglycerol kinase (ATP)